MESANFIIHLEKLFSYVCSKSDIMPNLITMKGYELVFKGKIQG